jgi:hypothetical protein
MSSEKTYFNADDLYRARKLLKRFMMGVSQILHYMIENRMLPLSTEFEKDEEELYRMLKGALDELEIDKNGKDLQKKVRLASILFEIDRLDEKSLESVGLIGQNLELKMYVFDKVSEDLGRELEAYPTSTETKRSFFDRVKKFLRWESAADSIMGSLAKLVPIIEPIIEFKEISSNTTKSLNQVENGEN